MEHIAETMIQLIGNEICGNTMSLPEDIILSEKFLVDLLVLSRKHNVAHIVASSLINNGYLDNSPQKGLFANEIYTAVYLQEKMNATFIEVTSVLENNKIPYIPLKGAVIRDMYPQPWLRTSCDIDILVRESDIESAVNAIKGINGYIVKGKSKHDIVIRSGNGTVLEIHYKLLGNKKSPLYSSVLSDVWKMSDSADKTGYRYKLSNEIFYYYHILHMAKHFRIGGCGIRPFIDQWLINKKMSLNSAELKKLLKKGKLIKFEKEAKHLSNVFFSHEEHDEITQQMQKYIIEGGIFGTNKTRMVSVNQRGKLGYAFSRIIVPYSYLKRDYPILEKYPILTPLCEIRRIFSFLFGKKKFLRENYIESVGQSSDRQSAVSESLFKDLGLR